ncbi:MAG TPA: hypothetical protein VI365_02015, partial [Trebonia sp.]
RAVAPVVTALAEAWLVPSSYVVEELSVMVSFWLPAVVSVKPVADTLLTVPIAPPAAGPDRALDPLPDPEAPEREKPLLLVPPLLVLLAVVELELAGLLDVAATIP